MIKMKAVVGGVGFAKRFRKDVQAEWKKALLLEGRAIKAEYEKTTSTWKHHVTFNIKTRVGKARWYVDVFSSGPNSRIYWFVHESISVMRGVLSPDWSPKTTPRVLSSGPGSGRLLYASKKIAKPPYKARKFTETIIKVRQPEFQKRMEQATAAGAKTSP